MNTLISGKALSIAVAVAAFAAVGSVPASAQSMSHDGSLLPHYFDSNGELKFGGWAPPAAEHQAVNPSRSLYLYAKPHTRRSHVRS
jgi:hypothetical protein